MQTADDNRAMRTRSSACGRKPSPAPGGYPNLLSTCESTTNGPSSRRCAISQDAPACADRLQATAGSYCNALADGDEGVLADVAGEDVAGVGVGDVVAGVGVGDVVAGVGVGDVVAGVGVGDVVAGRGVGDVVAGRGVDEDVAGAGVGDVVAGENVVDVGIGGVVAG